MVTESVQRVVHEYLRAATRAGIPTRKAVLFGSQASGQAHSLSDIDLVILSPVLEPPRSHDVIAALWRLRIETDSRIELVPCGEKEWETDDSRAVLEIARRNGTVIEA
ncbi:MAG: nucleotidyltransferase domain-containing protein [Phycisphaerae bacterium]